MSGEKPPELPGNAERLLGIGEEKSRASARRSQEGRSQEGRSQEGRSREGRSPEGRSQEEGRGWYTRGYLPHADFPGLLQSITYRLADSLPAEVLVRMEEELRKVAPDRVEVERRRRLEAWLDAGHGCCVLGEPQVAACVVENWRRFDGTRYDLIAWVVMPNHVHVLIRVYEGVSLGKIVQSWKSYTGRRIGKWLKSGGLRPGNAERLLGICEEKSRAGARRSQERRSPVWMREYWDRYIRDEGHFAAVVDYIHQNPMKAGLVRRAEERAWSSAREWAKAAEDRTE